jgi:hypothetical protein
MKPVKFPGYNVVFGEGQPEYQPLPALRVPGPQGEVITCWELTEDEIKQIAHSGVIYFKQLTFNQSLQPILPMTELSDDIELKL